MNIREYVEKANARFNNRVQRLEAFGYLKETGDLCILPRTHTVPLQVWTKTLPDGSEEIINFHTLYYAPFISFADHIQIVIKE